MDESKMSAKLGRVLRKGEYKVKIHELELNPANASEVGDKVVYVVVYKSGRVNSDPLAKSFFGSGRYRQNMSMVGASDPTEFRV